MEWFEYGPFTVFDVETTGMNPVHNRIIELAAVRVETDGSRTEFQSLIRPGCPIPREITRITRITDAMVQDAPVFHSVGRDFLAFAEESTLVAHNARFDLGFLQESLARTGLPLWQGKTMDTLKLVRRTHAGLPSYSLQNLRRTFNLIDPTDNMQAHRAGADVEWTVQLLAFCFNELLRLQK